MTQNMVLILSIKWQGNTRLELPSEDGLCTWASEGFFQGEPLGFFSKIFLGGAKSGNICFFPLETKKTTFFAKIFKIQGGKDLSAPPPLPTPMHPFHV